MFIEVFISKQKKFFSNQYRPMLSHLWLKAIGLILAVVFCSTPLLQATPAQALPAGFQEYYVLGNEEHIYNMFSHIDGIEFTSYDIIASNRMRSVVTVVATANNQTFYYDHWEDGYEADIFNPIQSSTQIYGDGNLSNGGSGTDILTAGTIVSLKSDGSGSGINSTVSVNSRGTDIRFDGGDYLVSTGGPVDLAHAMWPQDGTWIGGAWEIYSLQAWDKSFSYQVPVGVDSGFGDFKYAWLEIGALYDNTTVSIDNGTDTVVISLNKGQTYSSMGSIDSQASSAITINEGTAISADKQIQVGLVTGGAGTFQTRFYVMIPDIIWSTEYVATVPRSTSSQEAELYLYNPNSHTITVQAYDTSGNDTLTIDAGDVAAYSSQAGYVPVGSAARLESDDVFWGLVAADTSSTSYDWGFGLIPTTYLTDDYFTSWAPGNFLDPVSSGTNASPVWITPLADGTTFFVDYGPTDGVVDETFTMNSLETRRIFDSDSDNSGMHIWATDKFIPIWGVDPASNEAVNGFDLGYTILPLYQGWLDPVLTLDKTSDTEILPVEGGTATFTLDVNTYSPAPVTSINITDTLPLSWTYKTGTAIVTYPDDSTAAVEPAQNGQNLVWNLSQTMDANQNLRLQFEAQIQTGGTIGTTRFDDFEDGEVYNGGTTNWAGDWIETDSGGGGAGGGRVSVSNTDPYAGSYHLYLQNDNSIERSVDLTGFAGPMLRFKKKHQVNNNDEHWYLDVHNGVSYTRVLTWSNNIEEGSYYQEEVDLSPYITDTTKIRFSTSGTLEDGDYLYVDNVEIYDAIVVSENHAVATGTYRNHTFNAADSATVRISALDLAKTVDRATAFINDTLVYTLTYQNNGAITTTNTVINDLVPLNTTFVNASTGGTYNSATNTVRWNLGNVTPAATDVITFSVTVDRETTNGTEIENFGRISSDQTAQANSNLVKTTVQAPDLNISLSGPSVAAPGSTITYTLTYANNGAADATGVIISNTIPASMTYVAGSLSINTGSGWVTLTDAADTDAGRYTGSVVSLLPGLISGTIAAGETGQIRFAVTINPAVTEGSSIGNKAQIDSAQSSPKNSNLFSIDISPLSISKTSDVSTAAAGQTIAFTGAYANNGSITLTNVTLVDSIPANTKLISGTVTGNNMSIEYSTDYGVTWSGNFTNPTLVTTIRWTRANLSAGQDDTVNFQVRVADPLPADTTIQNVARITSTQTAATGWLYSNPVSIGTVDLTISKIAHTAFVRAGDPITYTITYGNNGSIAATSAVIADIIPANTNYVAGSIFGTGADDSDPANLEWNLNVPANTGGLKAGFVVTVSNDTAAGTAIYNTASVSNAVDDETSNQVQVTVAQDGVTISPNRSDNSHDQDEQVCYGHTVGNTGGISNTMELAATHNTWTSATVSFYQDNDADGNYDVGLDTALTDTNSNTTVDTGELEPGDEINILACFNIPAGANDGDSDSLTVETSTADGSPTYFSQVTDVTTVRIENFLTITSPAADLITNTTSISYTGTTNPNATIVITNTTTGVRYTVTADGFGNFAATITTTLGSNVITAQSTDSDNDVATDTRTITRTPDTTDSKNDVTIIQPAAGTITSTASVSVTGTTDPGSIITVTVGSTGPFTTTADSNGVYTVTVSLPDVGVNTIAVTSTDFYGNVDTATRDVTLTNDTTPDSTTVNITSPPVGYVTTATTTTVTGTGDPGATISIMVGDSGPFTTTVGAGGTFTVTVNLPTGGINTIEVTATDPYGKVDTASRDVLRHPFINFSSSSYSAGEGSTAIITVTLSAASNVTTTVEYATGNNTAIAGSDYTGAGGVLTFPVGSTSQVINIPVTNDGLDENNETFSITLSNPVSGTLGTVDSATVTIVDGDDPPTVNFSSGSANIGEGSGVYTFTVELNTASGLDVTIPFTVSGTATKGAGDDFTIVNSPITIPAGQTSAVITITINEDTDAEGNETVIVEIGAPTNATLGVTGDHTLTIIDNDFTLTRYTSGNGSLGANPNQSTYTYGEVVTLSATADPGWSLQNWSGDAAGSTSPITVTMNSNKAVTATFVQDQYTLETNVVGSGWIITSPVKSVYTYVYGEVVTLTAHALPGYTFTGWSGALSGTNQSENLTMDDNKVVTATFTQDKYSLTINQVGNGSVISNPAQSTYNYGDTITMTATADPGWTFTGWSGDLTSGDNPASFEIYGNTTVTATFSQNAYTLDVSIVGNGSVVSNPVKSTYHYGEVVTLTATADPGWTFTGWSGDLSGNDSEETITINGNQTVTATFTQDEYTLAVSTVGGGSVVSDPVMSTYHYGDVVTLTATADSGWTFVGWSGGLSGTDSEKMMTITGNTAVTATFSQNAYTLDISIVGNGSVISDPVKSTYNYGEVVTLTAAANSGWMFSGWSSDASGSTLSTTVTMTENKSVIATFVEDTSTTLNFSKTAMDVDGGSLLVGDAIRYTLQVINTGSYTASNVVITDSLPISVTLVSTSTTQGLVTGSDELVWNVGEVLPNNGTATMVITVTLNNDTVGQSIINTGQASSSNAPPQSDEVCPDGQPPSNGVCSTMPQGSSSGPGSVFLPIIIRSN